MISLIPKCSFCVKESVDSMSVECGNNAEYSITVYLCDDHLKESEELGYKFDEKYGDKIEKMNNERFA
jgi:replication-associated recombination protein RarA